MNIKYYVLVVGILSIFVAGFMGINGTNFDIDQENIMFHATDILSYDTDMINPDGTVTGTCYKVIDGDTIWVSGVGKVRFVCVNTPEKKEPGFNESKDFVKSKCLNKKVILNIDDKKPKDKYNRTLAVVYLDDGENLNSLLLKEGYAEIMFIPPSEFNPYTWT
ncbi:MAG: thermonuclease family protein [Methanobacteriaceae archaeon]|nr:thermonuclease family protein [Methanobacteriaceae archaeon]